MAFHIRACLENMFSHVVVTPGIYTRGSIPLVYSVAYIL